MEAGDGPAGHPSPESVERGTERVTMEVEGYEEKSRDQQEADKKREWELIKQGMSSDDGMGLEKQWEC